MKLGMVIASIAVTAISWGAYGPFLHKGALAMGESRMRAFLCVGVAYFIIGVVGPLIYINSGADAGKWTVTGTMWSLVAGAAGAIGALSLLMALTYGGTPIFVMPLVFGCAPVVSSFVSMYFSGNWQMKPLFLAGLILVAVGAVTVLITAPRGRAPAHGNSAPRSAPAAETPAGPS